MPQSEESTKQALILAFQLLIVHVEEIARLRASQAATLKILEGYIKDFSSEHSRQAAGLAALDAADVLRYKQQLQQMLLLIQGK
jgi:hypothetical protein